MSRYLPHLSNGSDLYRPHDILSLVRETAERATNSDPYTFPTPQTLLLLQDWGHSSETREIILDVVKARLALPWPYPHKIIRIADSHKALAVLSVLPTTTLHPLIDSLKPLAESEDAWLRLYAAPLLAIAVATAEEKEEEVDKVWNVPADIPWGSWALVQVGRETWWSLPKKISE